MPSLYPSGTPSDIPSPTSSVNQSVKQSMKPLKYLHQNHQWIHQNIPAQFLHMSQVFLHHKLQWLKTFSAISRAKFDAFVRSNHKFVIISKWDLWCRSLDRTIIISTRNTIRGTHYSSISTSKYRNKKLILRNAFIGSKKRAIRSFQIYSFIYPSMSPSITPSVEPIRSQSVEPSFTILSEPSTIPSVDGSANLSADPSSIPALGPPGTLSVGSIVVPSVQPSSVTSSVPSVSTSSTPSLESRIYHQWNQI